jgi:hypothetical protein
VDDERQRIIDKVKKLFVMAQQTQSPEEAKVATLRAQEILQKYSLSLSEIEVKEEGFANCGRHRLKFTKKRAPRWVIKLHAVVAINYGVSALREMGKEEQKILLLGIEPDVTVAKYTLEYLYDFVSRYSFKDMSTRERNDWRYGFVDAINERLRDINIQQSHTNSHTTALVLCKEKITRDYVSSIYKTKTTRKMKPLQVGNTYVDGFRVGSEIPLNQPLDENNVGSLDA